MSFNLPYKFQQSGRVVVIQHSHNGHVRVHPNNLSLADGGGQQGAFAQWKIHLEGPHHCRFQCTKTNKYLRIWRQGRETDVGGGAGPFTKFKIHYHSRPNGIKLESDRFPGRYIAVHPNRTMKIGNGGHHCNLWIKRQGQAVHVQKPQSVLSVGQGSFKAPYMFRQNNIIIITSNYGKNLRVHPQNTYNADGQGGTGNFARWRVILDGMGIIKLQNTHTTKYLRIQGNNDVNAGGGGGEFTRFRYHVHHHPNGVKLESCRFPGKYVAIRPNGSVMHGTGGVHTQLTFWREGAPQKVVVKIVHHQPQVHQVQQAQPVVSVGQGAFKAPYMFRQNNTIIIASNYGKNLRVSPQNTHNADGQGGTGNFARWRVILDGVGVIKLQNTHTNKYLRIDGNNDVNVGGGGGEFTRFRYHVHLHPNGVKLESFRFPGKYVAIRPNGNVMHGTGGVHTQLTFWREGTQQQVVYQQQPKVIVQQQPRVIVQQPPQVIVQQPSLQSQQQQIEGQRRQMEQQVAAQQQQMQQQMNAQQQQMQQQMEQIKLQNEISLQQQRQQMEIEKQKMEQELAQQQQQQQNEGVPVNPYYGNVVNNESAMEAPGSYPVLNKPISNTLEEKAPSTQPIGGQEAAHEVFMWLKNLNMERYYKTFIDNGYDLLMSVGEVSSDDLKEMGVALGHIKIILASSVTAPFLNKKVRVKSIRFETYLHDQAMKEKGSGMRCILQHNAKNVKGTVWIFEGYPDNIYRLKHVRSNTWLRMIEEYGEVDTRSPRDQWSELTLEKDENEKGVYYIKERKKDIYMKFEEPRTFGYNQLTGIKKRDAQCKLSLEIVK